MSFQRKPKKITFPEGHELHGLEVATRRPNVAAVEAVGAIGATEAEISTQITTLIDDVFGPALLSWNYTDEAGQAVPATPAGLRTIDMEALLDILAQWVGEAQGVPAGLGKESASGHSSPVRLLDGAPTVTTPGLSSALSNLHALNASTPS